MRIHEATLWWPLTLLILCLLAIMTFCEADAAARFSLEVSQAQTFDRRQAGGSSTDDDYSCSASKPCKNGACCGESGFCGYGPTYCGTGCVSNCDARAECGQYAFPANKSCPLNVCCSEFGFCGTTGEFCGQGCQSNCGAPNRPQGVGGDVRQSIGGYWESWSSTRTCGSMDTSQIPAEALSTLYYAFAYVVPEALDIVPMPGTDESLFSKITDLKVRNPDLKVLVSIGGWAFNDNNTQTQPVFSFAASSDANRRLFARKVNEFINHHGFDGVDLDWEYPGAPDRGGSDEDVQNYPLLLQALKSITSPHGGFMVSITVPTSYWYLRWFDLQALSHYLDYFNLMSYDLHGTWDSTNPIGAHVYAHTNLTEIDLALDLFWRSDIPSDMINLGIAFYGRTFELTDPACFTPGCNFKGPGAAGQCTNTPGIMSYDEITDFMARRGVTDRQEILYDDVAQVPYFVYNETSWISYDNQQSFQAKVDFANDRGLRGLFIWALDLDDPTLSALRSLTGKDVLPSPSESSTLGAFTQDLCIFTDCGQPCPAGWTKLTEANQNRDGLGCEIKKGNHQRSLCCPPWGAPDPKTCHWFGKPDWCYGQCPKGQVAFSSDKFGDNDKSCKRGLQKQFCCEAKGNQAAIDQCEARDKCDGDKPQEIAKWGVKVIIDKNEPYCCPAEPKWNNCKWYGDNNSCVNNRCPNGQVAMATSPYGDGTKGKCVLDRQYVLCCDPAFNNSALLPVELDWLFPDQLPASDAPVYFEAFDHNEDQKPTSNIFESDDPNLESFAWTMIVGPESSYQSLRKRDGSSLETFDCPTPAAKDFRAQKFKAVCMDDREDNNCEDILKGGAYGTVALLPGHCGPDSYVRVLSFTQIDDFALPAYLARAAPAQPKVYEIKYDYNFRHVKRDDGDIYIRFDTSNHPGYWNTIVNTAPDKPKRSVQDWRSEQLAWFEQHSQSALDKRGFSANPQWWLEKFNSLLTNGPRVGLNKNFYYTQVLYDARKSCPPFQDAFVTALVHGELDFNLDFGVTFIGTLHNFDFSQSYAYFDYQGLQLSMNTSVFGNAQFTFESGKLPIINRFQPFGAGFSIKNILRFSPYVDATAQIAGRATLSGAMSVAAFLIAPGGYRITFPQGIDPTPEDKNVFTPWFNTPYIQSGAQAAVDTEGSITATISPSIGCRIALDWEDQELAHTDVSLGFSGSLIGRVGASSSDCAGAYYGADFAYKVDVDVTSPFPAWRKGPLHWTPLDNVRQAVPKKCYPWTGSTPTRREISNISDVLLARATDQPIELPPAYDYNPLFPDPNAYALSCPNEQSTPDGDCHVSIADYGNDPSDDGAISASGSFDRRSEERIPYAHSFLEPGEEHTSVAFNDSLHQLAKRDEKKVGTYCDGGPAQNRIVSPMYRSSGPNVRKGNPAVYGLTNPTDCDDYGFGKVGPPADTSVFATEHVLEWQNIQNFLDDAAAEDRLAGKSYTDARAPGIWPSLPQDAAGGRFSLCSHLKFWWGGGHPIAYNGLTQDPMQLVAYQLPGRTPLPTRQWEAELVVLDKETNWLKERLWGNSVIRTDTSMNDLLAGKSGGINKAINHCRFTITAVLYQQIPEIRDLLVRQATRIGVAFDDLDNHILPQIMNPSYNVEVYEQWDAGRRWRRWIKNRRTRADQRAMQFLNTWVPKIEAAYGNDGNQAIRKRVASLVAARNALPVWTDPFPASW